MNIICENGKRCIEYPNLRFVGQEHNSPACLEISDSVTDEHIAEMVKFVNSSKLVAPFDGMGEPLTKEDIDAVNLAAIRAHKLIHSVE